MDKYNLEYTFAIISLYNVSQKNVPLCHFTYLYQILTDFQNFFTGTYCKQLAIKELLNISPNFNCVLHYHVKHKLSKITKITMKHMQQKIIF